MENLKSSPESKGHRVVQFPAEPNIWIGNLPFEELQRRYEAGEEEIRTLVEDTLTTADKWVAKPDAWYLDTIWHREPRGIFTCACPIHPFHVRYYSYFDWSLDDPWRLFCPLCKDEGREFPYYPNPRYPDEGDGCFPTDEVWREDHDEAWSRRHEGIPWDHWDGEAHGYVEPTNAFYFKALCWMNTFRALSGNVLRRLGEACHLSAKLKSDYDKSSQYAHTAKVILVTLSRAFLGDPYFAALLDTTEEELRKHLGDFYQTGTSDKSYPGYRLYAAFDHIEGDPKRPLNAPGDRYGTKGACLYPGVWNWKAGETQDLMIGYGLIAETFTEAEADLKEMALRIVTSVEGDTARLQNSGQTLKRGILEYTLHPYTLVTGADNLSTSTQMPRLQLGRIVGDHRIIENVARDILFFLHNFFTGDGLGKEGSPSYTGWGIASVLAACHGHKGDFNRDSPYFDAELEGINLLALPIFKHGLGQYLKTGFPNGRPITWEDCVIRAAMPLEPLALAETLGGGIPDAYRSYLHIDAESDPIVSLKLPMTLPSHLLGQNRKAVVRSGEGENARALSIDYTERVGHYHMAPLNLTLFAKGHELATDLGYMGSTHFMTVDWIKTFPAHNTVTIRGEDGDPMGTDNLRGDLRYFVDMPGLKAIDAAEEDASELAKVPGTSRYQRTVALVDVDPEAAYVIDIFRLDGGHLHDWTFHSNGRHFQTDGIDLANRPDQEESLYDYSRFTFTPTRRTKGANAKWGSERVAELGVGQSSGAWTATWGDVAEYSTEGDPPEIDSEVFLKLHMLDEPGSEVITGTGPAQRWLDNRDLGEQMKIVTVRRSNTKQLNTFVAIHEPYRDAPFIERVDRMATRNNESVAVQVTHKHGVDLILSNSSSDTCEIDNVDFSLQTDGELAFASFDADGLRSLSLVGGTHAKASGHEITHPPALEGLLTGFDDVEKTLEIRPDQVVSNLELLSGKTVTIRHRERGSAYTIRSAENNPDGTCTLALEGYPHLAIGYLLITAVEKDCVWVEPPPVIQGKETNLNLFRVEQNRSLFYLQPFATVTSDDILDEKGSRLRTRNALTLDNTEDLSADTEIALSPLHPGVDRFQVIQSSCWTRE
jgi:hypothetical protein